MMIGFQLSSQEVEFPKNFSKKEIKHLNQLNLKLNSYMFKDVSFNKDLKELASFNKKRKQNKVWAYTFSSVGALLLSTGLVIDTKKDLHGYKTLMYLNSALYFGGSIPFFVGNIKNKKKMKEKLIFVEEKLNTLQ